MKKRQVLPFLDHHIQFGDIRFKGERPFAQFFRWWLDKLTIPADEKYDFYHIDPYLPQLAVNAWEDMRTGTDAETIQFRHEYEAEVGRRVVQLMELHEDILMQGSAVTCISYVLRAVVDNGEWMEKEVRSYCHAQHHAIQGTFDKFLREVHGKGLFDIIAADGARGMKGKFGATELRTYVMAGRLMFTFARPKKKGGEVSVSFVAGDDDALGLEAGLQSAYASLPTAMEMIEEVIRQWPKEKWRQARKFRGNDNIAPDIIHAMRAQDKAEA